jgi:acetyl esterase/lipase
VAGDSSGGNLAAVVARKFRDQGRHLSAQLLLYPVIDSAGDYPSRYENASGYLLTLDDIVTSAENYLGNRPELLGSADVAPIHATDLRGLAPARRHRRRAPRPTPRRRPGLRRRTRRRQRRRLRQELPGNDPHLRLPLRNLRRRGPGVGRTAQRVPPSSAGPTLDP